MNPSRAPASSAATSSSSSPPPRPGARPEGVAGELEAPALVLDLAELEEHAAGALVEVPDRKCTGGLPGPWCGEPATHVARLPDGLEWFVCSAEHAYGAELTPIAAWFAQLDTRGA